MHTHTIHLNKKQHDWLSAQVKSRNYIDVSAAMEAALELLIADHTLHLKRKLIETQNQNDMSNLKNMSLFNE